MSLTKSGIHMMLISQVPSIRKRPRSSFKIPSVTSDPVTSSPKKLSMRFSVLSIRITPVPSRKPRWSFSSSNSSEETERPWAFCDGSPNEILTARHMRWTDKTKLTKLQLLMHQEKAYATSLPWSTLVLRIWNFKIYQHKDKWDKCLLSTLTLFHFSFLSFISLYIMSIAFSIFLNTHF